MVPASRPRTPISDCPMTESPLPPLLQPLTIRGRTLKNRIVISPMCQHAGRDGFATDWHLVHYGKFVLGGAALVLTESTAALDAWGARYGIFPGIELDLVATPVQQSVLGVSWTGLVMLSDALMLIDTGWIDSSPDTARFAIVHEIGHQWWGNMIGANSNDHPFMVEGLTNALSVEIAAEIYGADAAIAMLDSQIAGRFRQALTQNGDGIVDTPAGSEDLNGPGRAALAYGKGALGFLAIRLAMGDDAWHAAMEDFADTYLYDNAEPADLLAMLIAYAPDGVDVPAIWHHWFEEATATTAEIDALAAGIAARLRG